MQASTASWAATLPFLEFCQLQQGETSLFLATFEAQSSSKAAAAYADKNAYRVQSFLDVCLGTKLCLWPLTMFPHVQLFQEQLTAAHGDMHFVLQSTFSRLDDGFRNDLQTSGRVSMPLLCIRSITCCIVTQQVQVHLNPALWEGM